jgi:hypothetical protein
MGTRFSDLAEMGRSMLRPYEEKSCKRMKAVVSCSHFFRDGLVWPI